MKIIDAHAHVFEQVCGRKGDRPVIPGCYGCVTIGDEAARLFPPVFADCSCRAELLLEMMDFAGVEKAVLLQNPLIGTANDYIKACVERWPDRLTGTIQVDPVDPDACRIIERYASSGQHVLKLEMSEAWGWSGRHAGLSLSDPCFTVIWEIAARLGLRIIVDPGEVSGAGYQVEELEILAATYPSVGILIEHLGYMTGRLLGEGSSMDRWRGMLRLGRRYENVRFGVSAVWSLLGERYPCPGSQELLREAVRIVSADKLIWGSDLPVTLKSLTYRQMVDFVAVECRFLSEIEREKILGRNAACFFGL